PRVFEKLYANIIEKGHQRRGVERRVFDWALRVAAKAVAWRGYDRPVSPLVRAQWGLADKLVYSKIRKGVGGRVKQFISGGAPLAKELAEFFWSIGVPVYQGYGLTETSPVVSSNCPDANRIGTVGKPIPNVRVHIADDGEIMVQGPNVMQGYYRRPLETSAVLSPDRWLATGDIGELDAAGYLIITDRKKDLLKTAGGKLVAPQPIENQLKLSPYIQAAAVVGDRRKFLAALIVPKFVAVSGLAATRRMQFASQADLAKSAWVRELISKEVEKVNAHLAQYETLKRFVLLDADFSFDGGELTYTMKLRRRAIEQRYKDIIEKIYADVEEVRPASHDIPSSRPN
ncbi:MAG TPA: AMP-binding protein, partial [Candidatus Acidoferrales bacterium]|nr:AMP-binding protein [Candidatus Acidoferrales bacterium]